MLFRKVAGFFEMLSDWMEIGIFQVARFFVTAGVCWFLYQKLAEYRERVGGLTTIELAQFGQAAVLAAFAALIMSVLWSGSVCDGMAGVVLSLIDDPDNRPIQEDPMNKLSRLIHSGRIRRARRQCRRMIRHHEGSRVALEATLNHLANREEGKKYSRPERVCGGK
jgi:hypothetical protein